MIESIIDQDIFYKVAEPWMWETPLVAAEEALIARAVDKRKREFRAGRHSAHSLFDRLNISCTELLKGQQREPAWPQDWVGSISHTDGFCGLVLAAKSRFQSIGFDVEQATPLKEEIFTMICRPEELDHIAALQLKSGQKFASVPFDKLVFSAKESVHKTYFPLNYHTLDFLDARIEFEPEEQAFSAWIINPEPTPKKPILKLKGRYCVDSERVATLITLPA